MCLGTRQRVLNVFKNHSHAFSTAHRQKPLPESLKHNLKFYFAYQSYLVVEAKEKAPIALLT